MMHPRPAQLHSYRRRALSARELLEIDDHLAGCGECRRALAADAGSATALRRTSEAVRGEHLPYEWLERSVDGKLTPDEQAALDEHVALCEDCASELQDLGVFRRGEERQRFRWWPALAAAAAIILVTIVVLMTRQRAVAPVVNPVPTASMPAPSPAPPAPAVTDTAAAPQADPLESLSPSLQRVARQLESGALTSAALLASLEPQPERQRGASAAVPVRVEAPVGVVVETDRPSFRWERREDHHEVTVQIYDHDYALVAESPRLKGNTWRVSHPLPRGATYRWQLRIHLGDDQQATAPSPPEPPALFHILGSEPFAQLMTARNHGSELEAGLIAIREGLVAEGAQSLARYASEHPDWPAGGRLAAKARELASSEQR